LAAAQGLDEAQVQWGMDLEFETVESGGGKDEARRLFLLAAAQGSFDAYSQLGDISLDDNEENYWCEREDSVQNASLYSAGPPPRSATLTTLVSAKARLNDVVAAAAASHLQQIEQRLDATGTIVAAIRQQMEVLNAFVAANQQQMEQPLNAVVAASQQQMEQRLNAVVAASQVLSAEMEQLHSYEQRQLGGSVSQLAGT
jgi:hypothetical protein